MLAEGLYRPHTTAQARYEPMKLQQSITSLTVSPEQDRHSRMIKYSIAMGIRMICILLLFFVQGWWLLVMAIGAVVLPYIAVVLANVRSSTEPEVLRPGGLVSTRAADPVGPEK